MSISAYESFIEKCLAKDLTGIKTESHHILPKYLGGSDFSSNRIDLSPEDHALAHKLLFLENHDWRELFAVIFIEARNQLQSTLRPEEKAWVYAERSKGPWKAANARANRKLALSAEWKKLRQAGITRRKLLGF